MNVAQIIRKARIDADAIRIDQTISPLWGDEEMLGLVNEILDTVMAPIIRGARRHTYMRRMLSTDKAGYIFGQFYDPAGLQINSGTQFITLPPDFAGEVLRITPLVTNANTQNAAIRFKPRDVADPAFIESDLADQVNPGSISTNDFFYDVVGNNPTQVRLTPIGAQTVDVELLYLARQPMVFMVSDGTVVTDATGSEVTCSLPVFGFVPLPAELVFGTTANPSLQYAPVKTIRTANTLQLHSPGTATQTPANYILASIPPIPLIHHNWLAMMVTDMMARKISPQLAKERLEMTTGRWTQAMLPDLQAPRQSQEPVYTTPFIPDIM